MCPQVRDPSKRVQPAWRGGRAGGPQHRGRGALDEAGAGAWTPSARGPVQAELPATKLSSVCAFPSPVSVRSCSSAWNYLEPLGAAFHTFDSHMVSFPFC